MKKLLLMQVPIAPLPVVDGDIRATFIQTKIAITTQAQLFNIVEQAMKAKYNWECVT